VETIGIPLLSETMDRLLGATSSEQEVTADKKTTTAATVARCHLESLMQYSLDPLAQFVSDNVFGFTKAREPTVRAAEGFPPPFTEATFPSLRWQALRSNAPREPDVMRSERSVVALQKGMQPARASASVIYAA
jgi:hypothetical protein